MLTSSQQEAKQIDQGNKAVTVYLSYTRGQKGRKITTQKIGFTDLTLSKKTENQIIKEMFNPSTINNNLVEVAQLTKKLEDMNGDIVIAQIGYYEPTTFRYHTKINLMTRDEFNSLNLEF